MFPLEMRLIKEIENVFIKEINVVSFMAEEKSFSIGLNWVESSTSYWM